MIVNLSKILCETMRKHSNDENKVVSNNLH
jgi:hypothetical protein